ncbi:PP2C family protein-serine/threonine phosphatase [Kitasatospora albolonga]|uniref:PP2C family protein-serine/threonine phosphatase n=1 Tax=Kitasatospora albolonga TaxID=68173 RepID=UPI0031F0E6CE
MTTRRARMARRWLRTPATGAEELLEDENSRRARLWRTGLPLGVMALVTVVDLATGPGTIFYPFLVLGPALAAVRGRPREVVVIGLVALPLRYLLGTYDTLPDPTDRFFQINTVVFLVAIALSTNVARIRQRRERHLRSVTRVAVAAQQAILLPAPERLGGVRTAVRYFALDDNADVGGDLYSAVETPYGVRVLIGDVQGKGLGAVRTAAVALGAFRQVARTEPELDRVGRLVESAVELDGDPDRFVTALFVEFGPDRLRLLHRGHEAPVLVHPDGTLRAVEPPDPGLPLGLGTLTPGDPAPPWQLPFGPGDLLVLTTDGVTDNRDEDGHPYPLLDRLPLLLPDHPGPPDPTTTVAALATDLLRHVGRGRFTDDALMLALARDGDSGVLPAPSG